MLFNIAFEDRILVGCIGRDGCFYWDAESAATFLRYKAVHHFKLRHVKTCISEVATDYWHKRLSNAILDVPLIDDLQLKNLARKRLNPSESYYLLLLEWSFLIIVKNGPKFPELVYCAQEEPKAIRITDWSQSYIDKVLNRKSKTPLGVPTSPRPSSPSTVLKPTEEPLKDMTAFLPPSDPALNMEPVSQKRTDEPLQDTVSPGSLKAPPSGPFPESNTGRVYYTPCSPTYQPAKVGPCSTPYESPESGYSPCSPSDARPMSYQSSEADYVPCSPSYAMEIPYPSGAWRPLEEETSSKQEPPVAKNAHNPRHPPPIYSPLTTNEQLPSSPPPRELLAGSAPAMSVWWDTVPPNNIYVFYGNECRRFIAEK